MRTMPAVPSSRNRSPAASRALVILALRSPLSTRALARYLYGDQTRAGTAFQVLSWLSRRGEVLRVADRPEDLWNVTARGRAAVDDLRLDDVMQAITEFIRERAPKVRFR